MHCDGWIRLRGWLRVANAENCDAGLLRRFFSSIDRASSSSSLLILASFFYQVYLISIYPFRYEYDGFGLVLVLCTLTRPRLFSLERTTDGPPQCLRNLRRR